jgi:SAM-dependent methyltransferase
LKDDEMHCDTLPAMSIDARRYSPASERNREPILGVLREWLPERGHALELASGSGQHAVHFAAGLPGWRWQPSDDSSEAQASVAAWRAEAALPGLAAPIALDVLLRPWPVRAGHFDAVFCANLLHISPWPTCNALMHEGARCLKPGGVLLLYGPYVVPGRATAPSNLTFDAQLRARNPAWGLRDLGAVVEQARQAGLVLRDQRSMPANNLMLRFARADAP